MSEVKDIVAKELTVAERTTLMRLMSWGSKMNTAKESPFIAIGMGREREKSGITIYSSTECSKSQMVSLLSGIIDGIESGVIKIVNQ